MRAIGSIPVLLGLLSGVVSADIDETAMMQTKLKAPKARKAYARESESDILDFREIVQSRLSKYIDGNVPINYTDLCGVVPPVDCGYITMVLQEKALSNRMEFEKGKLDQVDLLMAFASGQITTENLKECPVLTMDQLANNPFLAEKPGCDGQDALSTEYNSEVFHQGAESRTDWSRVLKGDTRQWDSSKKTQPGNVPWHLQRIAHAENAPDGTYTTDVAGKHVNVYVIDSGIQHKHAEFGGRSIPGAEWQFISTTEGSRMVSCDRSDFSCSDDEYGHGTHCAGLAGGMTYGSANEAIVWGVKALGNNGAGSLASVAGGFEWVAAANIKPAIISASLGASGESTAVQVAVTKATDAGVLVVVAAGNQADNACSYVPAAYPEVTTVGATDIDDVRACFDKYKSSRCMSGSNFGSCVDIFAPGKDITSSWYRDEKKGDTVDLLNPDAKKYEANTDVSLDTFLQSGTSMAAPIVAGVAARIFQRNPTLGEFEFRDIWECESTKGTVIAPGQGSPNVFLFGDSNTCKEARGGKTVTPRPSEEHPATVPDKVLTEEEKEELEKEEKKAEEKAQRKEIKKAAAQMCFPGDGLAQVLGRGAVPMMSLRAGDLVLASGDVYEPVLDFLHSVEGVQGMQVDFKTVTHAQGEFRATANHLVFTAAGEKSVGELQVGDVLTAGTPSKVVALRSASSDLGMYAPLTGSGTIIVDGVLASSYAVSEAGTWLPQGAAHTLLYPLRVYHRLGLASMFASRPAQELNPFMDFLLERVHLDSIHKILSF